jgi:3-oxoacyl-[acyl-carrier protein] reductase
VRFDEKVALVTGGASGFGAEIARMFAREGADVAIAAVNEQGAQSVSAEIGNSALAVKCDVSVATDVGKAVEATRSRFGRVDIVINNAGTTHRNQPMLDVTEAEFDRVYAVNVKSIFHWHKRRADYAGSGRGSDYQYRLNRRLTAAARPYVVQRFERRGKSIDQIDGS